MPGVLCLTAGPKTCVAEILYQEELPSDNAFEDDDYSQHAASRSSSSWKYGETLSSECQVVANNSHADNGHPPSKERAQRTAEYAYARRPVPVARRTKRARRRSSSTAPRQSSHTLRSSSSASLLGASSGPPSAHPLILDSGRVRRRRKSIPTATTEAGQRLVKP